VAVPAALKVPPRSVGTLRVGEGLSCGPGFGASGRSASTRGLGIAGAVIPEAADGFSGGRARSSTPELFRVSLLGLGRPRGSMR
jgi:hypothetical protein